MFCAKCGTRVNDNDHYCPKCGVLINSFNNNVKNKKSKDGIISLFKEKTLLKIFTEKIKVFKVAISIVMFLVICVIVILLLNKIQVHKSYINYLPNGVRAFIDENNKAVFYSDSTINEISEPIIEGHTSPDQSKFILLDTDNFLFYETKEGQKVSISTNVDSISAINNSGCFYEKNSELYFFGFLSGKEIKVGMKDCILTYSAKKLLLQG